MPDRSNDFSRSRLRYSDAEAEAAETQTWIRFAVDCGYLPEAVGQELHQTYDHVIGKLVNMIRNPHPRILRRA